MSGFPELIEQYHIGSVPKTVIGERVEFVGARSEAQLLQSVLEAARGGSGAPLS